MSASRVLALLLALTGGSASAELTVQRAQLGMGVPQTITIGSDVAVHVSDGYYHVPGYLPAYPTAGAIWPRVVEVQCDRVDSAVLCDGVHWLPSVGRAEYVMLMPKVRERAAAPPAPAPIVIYREAPAPVPPAPEIVYRDVHVACPVVPISEPKKVKKRAVAPVRSVPRQISRPLVRSQTSCSPQ